MKFLPTNPLFQQDHFGLSISQNALRAVAITSGKTIRSQAEVLLNSNILDHGILDKPALTAALTKLLSQGKFTTSYTCVILPDNHSFSRLHTLPKIDFEDITEALSWQIEKIFPLPKQEIYFDWKLIAQNQTELTVLVVALNKTLLDDLVEIFEQIGIRAISFEPAASVLTHILPSQDRAATSILAQINQSGSSATLIENGLSTLTVTNRFEAGTDTNISLQRTNQSIQELLSFYSLHHDQSAPPVAPPAYLTGESATVELADWFKDNLKINMSLMQIPGTTPAFHEAYAAAASSILPPQSHQNINLLPGNLQNIYNHALKYKQLLTTFQISLVILVLAIASIAAAFAALIFAEGKANAQLVSLDAAAATPTYDTKLVAALNQNSTAITTLFPLKTTPLEVFRTIDKVTPSTINLASITFTKDKNTFILIGRALTREELLRYKSLLASADTFKEVIVPLQSLETTENVDFSISATINNLTP